MTPTIMASCRFDPRSEEERRSADVAMAAALASHDLQAPGRQVLGLCDIIEELVEADADEELTRCLSLLRSVGARSQVVTRALSHYLRLGTSGSAPHPVDVAAIAARTIAGLEPDQRALIHGSDELVPTIVLGQQQELELLVHHLMDNAIRHGSGADHPRIDLGVGEVDGSVQVVVADNGVGLDADDHEVAFQPFRKLASGAGDGPGVGLAIVRRVAELHDGWVQIDAELHVGCRIVVDLPAGPRP